jgi:hypothetical protein
MVKWRPQEIVQLVGTTLNENEVTSSNPLLPSSADKSKKKKKKKDGGVVYNIPHVLIKEFSYIII